MIKKYLFIHCKVELERKLNVFENQKNELKQALNSESKSSAGDKYETGRAMIHLEMEKLGNQIADAERKYKKLQSLKNQKNKKAIGLGSVVFTDKANYYVSIAADLCKIDLVKFYCISTLSPIGLLLLGKKINDKIEFNNQVITIIKIL
mgnify:CR=1 FL=1